jgi:hypothetical protein
VIAFILGTGRCGSTLVHELLCRHPDVAFVSNIDTNLPFDSKGRWNNSIYRLLPSPISGRTTTASAPGWGGSGRDRRLDVANIAQKLRLRFAPSEGYQILAKTVSPLLWAPTRDITEEDLNSGVADRFRRFFLDRLKVQHRTHFVHHFTGWPRARFIHGAIPEALFIHVVRDGRAVAASLMKTRSWRASPGWVLGQRPERYLSARYLSEWEEGRRSLAVLAGLQWKMLIDAYESVRKSLPDQLWHEVRYEDFVAAPKEMTGNLLGSMDLPWGRDFEQQFNRYTFAAGRSGSFARELSPRDLGFLNRMLEEHLARLGYSV